MTINTDAFMNYSKQTYRLIETILIFAYIVVYFGLFYINPSYIYYLSTFAHAFVSIFLIYKFHPLREHILTKHDGHIIFTSALFMLSSAGLTEVILNKFDIRI